MSVLSGDSSETSIVIGRLHGAFGVRGWVRVESFTETEADIVDYQPWLVDGREVQIDEVKPHGRGLVVKLNTVDDRDQADALKGQDIRVHRDVLPEPEPGEYYWRDLTGLTVVTRDGVALGKVHALMETGANDVFVVRGEREHLLPWTPDVVIDVNIADRSMTVDWDPDF